MVSSCPKSAAALWLQEVTVQVVTPPAAGTTYEFPETTLGWARSVSADVSDDGEFGASWPIVTDAEAGEAIAASDSAARKPVSAMRFIARCRRMAMQRP
jgi:hypothetical protein